jgi:hypothetical protein
MEDVQSGSAVYRLGQKWQPNCNRGVKLNFMQGVETTLSVVTVSSALLPPGGGPSRTSMTFAFVAWRTSDSLK